MGFACGVFLADGVPKQFADIAGLDKCRLSALVKSFYRLIKKPLRAVFGQARASGFSAIPSNAELRYGLAKA
ncbi:MAG: hypothetical protein KDJ67_06330 [Nitratireductor sp.]|nr:hypothetical protein [Nitratireductor sp.]